MPSADIFDSRGEANWVTLSRKPGCCVYKIGSDLVYKQGKGVTRNEEFALWLVRERSAAPVPKVYASRYRQTGRHGRHRVGHLLLQFVEGTTLESSWDDFDESTKERICRDVWALIGELRRIPRPAVWAHIKYCSAEGSPTSDVLVEGVRPALTVACRDVSLWSRISERYRCGRTKPAAAALDARPPAVFTHGNIAPRNIMVDAHGHITGLLGWEKGGWYPDHWECAEMMKPSREAGWQAWMERTRPSTF